MLKLASWNKLHSKPSKSPLSFIPQEAEKLRGFLGVICLLNEADEPKFTSEHVFSSAKFSCLHQQLQHRKLKLRKEVKSEAEQKRVKQKNMETTERWRQRPKLRGTGTARTGTLPRRQKKLHICQIFSAFPKKSKDSTKNKKANFSAALKLFWFSFGTIIILNVFL